MTIPPIQRNRELFWPSREFWRKNRKFYQPKSNSSPDELFCIDKPPASPQEQCASNNPDQPHGQDRQVRNPPRPDGHCDDCRLPTANCSSIGDLFASPQRCGSPQLRGEPGAQR